MVGGVMHQKCHSYPNLHRSNLFSILPVLLKWVKVHHKVFDLLIWLLRLQVYLEYKEHVLQYNVFLNVFCNDFAVNRIQNLVLGLTGDASEISKKI